MKNLLFIILLVLSSNSFGQLQTYKTYYDPLTRTKLHEVWSAKPVSNSANGLKHGLYKEFDVKGNLIREMQYENGKQNGYSKVYFFVPDYLEKECYGKLIGSYKYKNGLKHGSQIDYDCHLGEMTLRKKAQFENGLAVSEETFHRNGSKESVKKFNGINKEWDNKGGIVAEYSVANGIENGEKTIYHPNGRIKMKGVMKDGEYDGEWLIYDKNGNIVSEFRKDPNTWYFSSLRKFTLNGTLYESVKVENGIHFVTVYDSISGSKLFEEYRKYRDDTEFNTLERLNYYEFGGVKSKFRFTEGGQINLVEAFNKTGDIVGGGSFDKYGDPVGLIKIFRDKSGKWSWDPEVIDLKYEINFDRRMGDAKVYDKNGNLIGSGAMEFLNITKIVEVGDWEYLYSSGEKRESGTFLKGDKHGEWQQFNKDGLTNRIQKFEYGELTDELTARELEAAQFEKLKLKLKKKYSDFENQNSNSNVRFYKYRARNSDRYIIFQKGLILITHFNSQIENCTELECLIAIESKLLRIDEVMKKYQNEDPGKLIVKLKLARKIEKIEQLFFSI